MDLKDNQSLEFIDHFTEQGPIYEALNSLLEKCLSLNTLKENKYPEAIIEIFRTSLFNDFNNYIVTNQCSEEELITKRLNE